METVNSNENPYRSSGDLATEQPGDTPCRKQALSWKRVMKLLCCFMSVFWVIMLHFSMATAGGLSRFAPASSDKIILAALTAAAMIPILLFLRGRWMYVLGFPTLLLAALTIYVFLSTIGTPNLGP